MIPTVTLTQNSAARLGEKPPAIFLASASPRRLALLRQIGIEPIVVPTAIDESRLPQESIIDFVHRMALTKAHRLLEMAPLGLPEDRVIAADTVVVVQDQLLGKPDGPQQAVAILQQLSGRWHQVMTAVAVCRRDPLLCWQKLVISHVHIRPLQPSEIVAYVASGEPLDKAGAYAIQGLAACFVTRLHGSYSGVVGLPLAETSELLLKAAMAS
ncbi:MAG: septum formation inhibitor Maf [Magnetococcales bacterium]|nr:septum formation inhibitor Maf [Magnetococcales bacterium]